MGNKSSSNGAGNVVDKGNTVATAFVLKVAMHCQCQCHGCVRKVTSAVRKLKGVPGVQVVDESTLETTGEVRVLASTADPEMLRRRIHRATSKHLDLVDLVLRPKLAAPTAPPIKESAPHHDDHQPAPPLQYYGGWPPNHHHQYQQQPQVLGGGGWNNGGLSGAGGAAYPWEAAAYPAAAWGSPYAYPPPPPPPPAGQGGGHGGRAYPPPPPPAGQGGGHGGGAYYCGGAPAWQR